MQSQGEKEVVGMYAAVWMGLLALMDRYPWTLDLFSGPPSCSLPPLCVLGLCGSQGLGVGAGSHCSHHLACSGEALTPRCWVSLLFSAVCKQLRLGGGQTPAEKASMS